MPSFPHKLKLLPLGRLPGEDTDSHVPVPSHPVPSLPRRLRKQSSSRMRKETLLFSCPEVSKDFGMAVLSLTAELCYLHFVAQALEITPFQNSAHKLSTMKNTWGVRSNTPPTTESLHAPLHQDHLTFSKAAPGPTPSRWLRWHTEETCETWLWISLLGPHLLRKPATERRLCSFGARKLPHAVRVRGC